jgi:hypothetical protein
MGFQKCESLKSICIPAFVKELADECFIWCTSLESVTFESPSHLAAIRDRSFQGCESLKSLCAPRSVEMFDDISFRDCPSFSLLTFESPSHLQGLRQELPFFGAKMDVPDSVKYIA